MSDKQKPVIIIPKEQAVFRLDGNGVWWHIDGEKFSNPKIIDYFHSMIQKDEGGFFLEQEHEHYIDKVYFSCEDTALFVFGIIKGDRPTLCLNTGKKFPLDPEKLMLKNDSLYIEDGNDLIKFNERAMFALADYMEDTDGQYVMVIDGERTVIPGKD